MQDHSVLKICARLCKRELCIHQVQTGIKRAALAFCGIATFGISRAIGTFGIGCMSIMVRSIGLGIGDTHATGNFIKYTTGSSNSG